MNEKLRTLDYNLPSGHQIDEKKHNLTFLDFGQFAADITVEGALKNRPANSYKAQKIISLYKPD